MGSPDSPWRALAGRPAVDRPVALVGASRGGQCALVGGSRHPDRVRLIMLADVAPHIDDAGRILAESLRDGTATAANRMILYF